MPSLILDFLDFNKNIDYGIIIPLAFLYVFIFWFIVSGWVYFDSKKRTKNKVKGLLIGFGNLIFGVPYLILYLLIRPSDFELEADLLSEASGGVNVPVVNFVGKDGMVMSLELRINSAKLAQENASEMKVDVSFDSQDDKKKIDDKNDKKDNDEIVITQTVKGQKLETVSNSFKGRINKLKRVFSGKRKDKQENIEAKISEEVTEDPKDKEDSNKVDTDTKVSNKQPSSKKKNKKKNKNRR